MSKFTTTIPVDVQEVVRALPAGSSVQKINVKLESSLTTASPLPVGIEIIWDNDQLKTPYTFPLDFPLKKLMRKK